MKAKKIIPLAGLALVCVCLGYGTWRVAQNYRKNKKPFPWL